MNVKDNEIWIGERPVRVAPGGVKSMHTGNTLTWPVHIVTEDNFARAEEAIRLCIENGLMAPIDNPAILS